MKIEELRIGNLITDVWAAGQPFPVLMISNKYPVVKYGIDLSSNIDNIVGIPLTEEWLLKFGFEYIGICDDFPKGYYKHKALTEICFDNTFEPAVNDWGATYIMVPEMKYVHQLQNLFYALTGEELTLKSQAPQSQQE